MLANLMILIAKIILSSFLFNSLNPRDYHQLQIVTGINMSYQQYESTFKQDN
jgi:hypothetical protein